MPLFFFTYFNAPTGYSRQSVAKSRVVYASTPRSSNPIPPSRRPNLLLYTNQDNVLTAARNGANMVNTIDTTAKRSGNGGLNIYVPQELRVDSQNPIHIGDDIRITVDGQKMIIEPR